MHGNTGEPRRACAAASSSRWMKADSRQQRGRFGWPTDGRR
ncbi:Hypothetical protein A7982_07999 [Minicystis rosea]|nr:Hypothetical protein A7982_07999 [Minicystis rosea]